MRRPERSGSGRSSGGVTVEVVVAVVILAAKSGGKLASCEPRLQSNLGHPRVGSRGGRIGGTAGFILHGGSAKGQVDCMESTGLFHNAEPDRDHRSRLWLQRSGGIVYCR